MKVKELLALDIDIDVYDDVCEELGIAFCGPAKLTAEGKREFADVLEYDVTVSEYCAIVDVDGEEGIWQEKLRKAKKLFYSLAGYCPDSYWNRWFKD